MNSSTTPASRTWGALSAFTSFFIWGCFPLFWKQLHAIGAVEAIAHRVVWSLAFLVPVVLWQRKTADLLSVFRSRELWSTGVAASLLLAGNWLIYIWAVNHGMVVESSLGYFLVPLVNAVLGRVFLREHVRPLQWLAIVFAALGVGYMLLRLDHVPWVAFGLAATWSTYGLLKKRSKSGPVIGLTLETLVLIVPAGGLLLWLASQGEGGLGHADGLTQLFILLTGVVTAVPLLLFARGAQVIRFVTLGLLQYITPTVQFLIGVYVYDEPFDQQRLQAFALIWLGLALYSSEAVWHERRRTSR